MLKISTLLVALLTLTSLSSAAQAASQQKAVAEGTQSVQSTTACEFFYSSGNGATSTEYCLTANGNIVQFASPSGFEFINAGGIVEGYGICEFTSEARVSYFDYGQAASNNWGPTTVTTPNARTKTFVRTTNDGNWRLTQTISQIKATASSVGAVKVTMALRNLSANGRSILLLRFADVDANATTFDDNFNATRNSAFGSEPGPGLTYGLGLTNNTFTISNYTAFTRDDSTGPDPCNLDHLNSGPFTGDGSIGITYLVGIPAGASKTFTMTYKPM